MKGYSAFPKIQRIAAKTVLFYLTISIVYPGPLSGATIPGQSGPGSDGNEGVLRIPQRSSIAGTSPSDCLSRTLVGDVLPLAENQSVYSTAPADWASNTWNHLTLLIKLNIL